MVGMRLFVLRVVIDLVFIVLVDVLSAANFPVLDWWNSKDSRIMLFSLVTTVVYVSS